MRFPRLTLTVTEKLLERGRKVLYTPPESRLDKGDAVRLPESYKKFWREWRETESTPVHFIPKEGKYEYDPEKKVVLPVQNVPIPVYYPPEMHSGLWGGEGVVRGLVKKGPKPRVKYDPRIPRLWVPALQRSVVYSEVLNKYMSVICTRRAMNLIHENYGLDYYLLKTPAYDLKSLLALKMKRLILQALFYKTLYPDNEKKREEIYNKYKEFLTSYTEEDLEWYGLSLNEALWKLREIEDEQAEKAIKPLKHLYRMQLLDVLKKQALEELEREEEEKKSSSWLGRIKNPFSSNKGDSAS